MAGYARRPRWLWSRAVGLVLLALAAVALGVLVEWTLPALLTRHPSRGMTAAERLKAANDVRAPLVGFLVALGAAGTLWFTARTYRLNQDGHVTDRYTSAVGQLGDDSAHVRVGGIYALERIGNDSAKDRRTIVYVWELSFVTDQRRADPVRTNLLGKTSSPRFGWQAVSPPCRMSCLTSAVRTFVTLTCLLFREGGCCLPGPTLGTQQGCLRTYSSISGAASDGGGLHGT